MLVVAKINVGAYLFLVFSGLTSLLEYTGCTVPPDSKETKFGNSQEASLSAGKSIRAVLVPCYSWKCVPLAISSIVNICKLPGCHLLWQISSEWGSQKLPSKNQCLMNSQLTSDFYLFLTQWTGHIIKGI